MLAKLQENLYLYEVKLNLWDKVSQGKQSLDYIVSPDIDKVYKYIQSFGKDVEIESISKLIQVSHIL